MGDAAMDGLIQLRAHCVKTRAEKSDRLRFVLNVIGWQISV